MLKYIFIGLMLVSSSPVLAEGLQVEAGSVTKLGDEATTIARLLLNRQIAKCNDEFQQEAATITDVTMQEIAPGHTQYQVRGMVFVGGDVPSGQVVLSIDQTVRKPAFGFGTIKSYSCNVTRNN